MEGIGDRVRRYRRRARLSQEQLAERSGVPRGYIADLESGQMTMPRNPKNLRALAVALGVGLRTLAEPIGWYDDPMPDVEASLEADPRFDEDTKAMLGQMIRLALDRKAG